MFMRDFITIDKNKNLVKCIDGQIQVKLFGKSKWIDDGCVSENNYFLGYVYRFDMTRNGYPKFEAWGVNKIILSRMIEDGKIIINTMTGIYSITKREFFNRPSKLMVIRPGKVEQYLVPQVLMRKISGLIKRY
jgi:hypothetical protein